MTATVIENVPLQRFELLIVNGVSAAVYYRIDGENLFLIHTEVPFEFSGQGIATRLAHGTFALLRSSGRKAVLRCPFMSRFLIRHMEYADIVVG